MRVGVIGAGIMGENHVRVYAALANHCSLTGIYDTDLQRAGLIAAKYHTAAFDSLPALLDQVDAVTIAAPTPAHYEIGLACIAKGIHMLIEKPLALTVPQGRELVAKSAEAGLKLQVGHIELYNPVIQVLRQIIVEEEVIAVDIHRMSPFEARWQHVNVVDDLMIHDIYILHDLLQARIGTVHAVGHADGGVIRHAAALVRTDNGLTAQLTASFITEERIRTIRIVTKRAFIQADLLDKKVVVTRSTRFFQKAFHTNYAQQNIVEKIAVPSQEPLLAQLQDFLACIRRGKAPRVPGQDGIHAMEVTNRITKLILQEESHE